MSQPTTPSTPIVADYARQPGGTFIQRAVLDAFAAMPRGHLRLELPDRSVRDFGSRSAGTTLPLGLPAILGGRLRALGSLAYYLSYHLVRYYAAALILIALIVPGFWAWALPLAAFVCAAGVDHAVRKPPLSFIRFGGIYLLEQLAYGTGVFWGCLSRRCFASYRVVLLRQMEQPA